MNFTSSYHAHRLNVNKFYYGDHVLFISVSVKFYPYLSEFLFHACVTVHTRRLGSSCGLQPRCLNRFLCTIHHICGLLENLQSFTNVIHFIVSTYFYLLYLLRLHYCTIYPIRVFISMLFNICNRVLTDTVVYCSPLRFANDLNNKRK